MILDRETSEKLYRTYYMQVYSYVMTLAKNEENAEEITQETFYRAMATERKFRGEAKTLTWLCAIAKNLYFDQLRKRSKIKGSVDPKQALERATDHEADLQQSLADKDTSFRIHMILHELEEPYREVFQLRVFGELSFKQIGTIFRKTENWARVTYHRAKLKIRERMTDHSGRDE